MGSRNRGRPSSFKKEHVEQARKIYELGATDREVADVLDIAESTLYRWAKDHPEFAEAMKVGKSGADDRVERSLYHKAVGYTYPSEKVFQFQGDIVRTPVTEHVPPDTTACIFWLKNRRKDDWRDRQQHELSGKDGGPIETRNVTDEDRARALTAFLKRTRGRVGEG